MDGLPDHGKIVIAAPAVAARMAEVRPDLAHRIFCEPGPHADETIAYVINLDSVNERAIAMLALGFPR